MIRFLHPDWFFLLLLVPLVAFWLGRKGAIAAVEYSSVEVARRVARETRSRAGQWLLLLKFLSLLFLIVALARPQLVRGQAEVQASGIDLVLALDISGSMQSLDLDGGTTSRIDVVKKVVSTFIDARPDDRIGMVAFAGDPYLVSPLTLDHDWLQQNLDRVKIGTVDDGTAIGSAIGMCVNRLRPQASKSKIIILLTDGQNNSGKISPEIAAEAAKALGIKIYTIGVGVRGEAPFPVKDAFGRDQIVMMKVDVDEDALKKIADETGGKFFRATDRQSLEGIYHEIDQMEKTTHVVKKFEHHTELFAWAVIPALLLLGAGFSLEQTRYRRLP